MRSPAGRHWTSTLAILWRSGFRNIPLWKYGSGTTTATRSVVSRSRVAKTSMHLRNCFLAYNCNLGFTISIRFWNKYISVILDMYFVYNSRYEFFVHICLLYLTYLVLCSLTNIQTSPLSMSSNRFRIWNQNTWLRMLFLWKWSSWKVDIRNI